MTEKGTGASPAVICMVVAVEQRRSLAEALLKKLKDQGLAAEAVFDRKPPQPPRGENYNHLLAIDMALVSQHFSHILLIQDDAIIEDWFADELRRRVAANPSDVLGLYLGNHRPHVAVVEEAVARAREDESTLWLNGDSLYYGVATVFPRDIAADVTENANSRIKGYDMMVGVRLRETGRRVSYAWPSLVDHAGNLPTTIPGRSKVAEDGRRAHEFGPASAAAWAGRGSILIREPDRSTPGFRAI